MLMYTGTSQKAEGHGHGIENVISDNYHAYVMLAIYYTLHCTYSDCNMTWNMNDFILPGWLL